MTTPNIGSGVSPLFWSYWVALPSLDMRAFAQSYCILLCCIQFISLDACFSFLFFLKGNREVVDLGRELEGEEEGEYVVGIYCVRED